MQIRQLCHKFFVQNPKTVRPMLEEIMTKTVGFFECLNGLFKRNMWCNFNPLNVQHVCIMRINWFFAPENFLSFIMSLYG